MPDWLSQISGGIFNTDAGFGGDGGGSWGGEESGGGGW